VNSQDSTGAAQGAPVLDSPRRGLGQAAAPLGRFLPLDAILARYMLSSVCLSVCPSQAGIVSKRQDESSWFLPRMLPSIYPTLYYREFWVAYLEKLWYFPLELWTYKNTPQHVDRVVNNTHRRSSLRTIPIRQSTSRGCLLHVGQL